MESPNSIRALENATLILSRQPETQETALELLRRSTALAPDDPILALKYFSYACPMRPSERFRVEELVSILRTSYVNWQISGIFEASRLVVVVILTLPECKRLLSAVKQNARYQRTSIPLAKSS